MVLWLRSNASFNRFARLDTPGGGVAELDSGGVPQDKARKPDGNYDRLSGTFVALYVDGARVVARFGDRTVPLDGATSIHLAGPPRQRRLIVVQAGAPVLTLDYSLPEDARHEDDLTAFVEKEDDDFGLFIRNVCENPHRQQVLIEVAQGG